ncbi:HlyC/CorC family transporter [Paeniglutamicibacter antarcticus]|uniref:HlyC/CorC family transporter n=1 Tax=Arthrobacter terrae TaxID=2935737 RepID=A0A931CSR9_9MICC|nr:hemolysin family protein [Arthrobacter terrae]MBG0740229.1 HlyC/CorC family transporter [Arthrobacter terrae]
MITLALTAMGLVFLAFAAVLTAADAAFNFFPRHDAEIVAAHSRGVSLAKIMAAPVTHMNALRFWRVFFEMAVAVSGAVLFLNLMDNIWLAGLVATAVITVIAFVLVGVSPRQLGRLHSAAVVGRTAALVRFLCWLLGPVPGWLVRLGNIVAPGAPIGDDAFVSEEEFREFVDRASDSEMIEDNEAELIQSVFDLGDTVVRSVMVPRTDMVGIDKGSTLAEAMTLFLDSGYSRIPVIGDNTDQILGILYLKDVVATEHRLAADGTAPAVEIIARAVRYVPDSKLVTDLLKELQVESTHVAIVIDEYGGTAGLVTLEDLIEEIVGEIVDEYDSEAPEVQDLGHGRYLVSARLGVDDLGELFGLDLDDDEVDTVGGLLAKHLGRVPIVGSEAQVAGIRLHAQRLEGRRNRVSHIIATAPLPADTESTTDNAFNATILHDDDSNSAGNRADNSAGNSATGSKA